MKSDPQGILEFKVPREVPTTILDVVTRMNTLKLSKYIMFTLPLEATVLDTPSQPLSTQWPKPALKKTATCNNNEKIAITKDPETPLLLW